MPDRGCDVGLVGEAMALTSPGRLAERGCQLLVVREDDPQWHLRELTHETGLEEREVHAEGADERGRPLPLEQFRDDNVGTWARSRGRRSLRLMGGGCRLQCTARQVTVRQQRVP